VHGFGYARAFAPEKDCIIGGKSEVVECHRPRCRHQDKSRSVITLGEESFPGRMPPNRQLREVIKDGALEASVVEKKAARLDQVDAHSEAGRKPQ
jgi:hypothetical protein